MKLTVHVRTFWSVLTGLTGTGLLFLLYFVGFHQQTQPDYEQVLTDYLRSQSMYQPQWFELRWQGRKVGFVHEYWSREKGAIAWHQQLKISGIGRAMKVVTTVDEQLQFSDQEPHLLLSGYSHHVSTMGARSSNQWSRFKVQQHKLIISRNGQQFIKDYPQFYSIGQHLFPALLAKLSTAQNQYYISQWNMDNFSPVTYYFFNHNSSSLKSSWQSQQTGRLGGGWQSIWQYDDRGQLSGRYLVNKRKKRGQHLVSYQLSSRKKAQSFNDSRRLLRHEYVAIDRPLGRVSTISGLDLQLSGIHTVETRQNKAGGLLHIQFSTRPEVSTTDQTIGAETWLDLSGRYPHLSRLDEMTSNLFQAETTTMEKTKILVKYVSDFIRNEPVLTPASLQSVLNDPVGDCTEHALLFVALARNSGIPAREVNGLLYLGDEQQKYQAHVWAEVFIDHHWLAVDPTWDRIGLDAGYIQIHSGSDYDASIATARLVISGKKFHLKSLVRMPL